MPNFSDSTLWRMQLHPDDHENAFAYSVRALTMGVIGLDFKIPDEIQHLGNHSPDDLGDQAGYYKFYSEMKIGDVVLILTHHKPLALCVVSSDYQYVDHGPRDLGVWFRHYRRVDKIRYAADYFPLWRIKAPDLKMTGTIFSIKKEDGAFVTFIREWLSNEYSNDETN